MKRLRGVALGLVAVAISLTLAASATGTTAKGLTQTRQFPSPIEALAIDGNRIAYDVGSTLGKNNNKVVVWDLRTGKTTTVSGERTRTVDDSSTGAGVFQLAIAGTRVAWLANVGGNTEGDDYLFSSSVTKPSERKLASEQRFGDNCPGRSPNCAGGWLGGLVGSGNLMTLNTWTTDATGAVTAGALDVLGETTLTPVATGLRTVEAVSADHGRVAAFQPSRDINVYSSDGTLLEAVSTRGPQAVALSGNRIIVLTRRRQLGIWDLRTGMLGKTFAVHGSLKQPPKNLDAQGNIAIYSMGPSLHAVNLSSGKDSVIAKLSGSIGLARIGSAGVVYSNHRSADKGRLVFLPWARVAG